MQHISIPTVRSDIYVTKNISAVVSFLPAVLHEGLHSLITEHPIITLQGIAEALYFTVVGQNAGLRRKTDFFPTCKENYIIDSISNNSILQQQVSIRIRRDNLSQSIIANYISAYYNIPINIVLKNGVFNQEIFEEYLREYMEKDTKLFVQNQNLSPTIGRRKILNPTGFKNTDHITPEFLNKSARVAQWTLKNQKNTEENSEKKRLAPELEAFLQM
jgi:hypothetical protein